MTETTRPSIFLSYAHRDGFDFTLRLFAALRLHMDVFWDKHLESGKYPPQLFSKIEECQFFLLVMSPWALRRNGWCKREFDHAKKHKTKAGIILAKPEGTSVVLS